MIKVHILKPEELLSFGKLNAVVIGMNARAQPTKANAAVVVDFSTRGNKRTIEQHVALIATGLQVVAVFLGHHHVKGRMLAGMPGVINKRNQIGVRTIEYA